uniref:gamma-aminobutyric acid receptor subunit rho-2-like n=1 Tax=Ciona intestinalis TaxID=7719 RepID=UPI000EF4F817|nr:gamma-aminobutyric acid receptor subunit rho-2-like [Ciona intestinalis]|eukprot:XP_026692831.1 gamma-aminobutyric acid receptor subunit rho-2-like [Ciona intestinalis]
MSPPRKVTADLYLHNLHCNVKSIICNRFLRLVVFLVITATFGACSETATTTRHTKTRAPDEKPDQAFWGGVFTPPLPQDSSRSNDRHGSEITKQIEEMFRDHNYELSIRPRNHGKPIRVGLALMIESITDISEKNMDLTFTLCMHETWTDTRLKFISNSDDNSIVLPSRLISKLWVPDLYIVGSKSSFIHKTTVDNLVLRLFNDGSIFYNVQ